MLKEVFFEVNSLIDTMQSEHDEILSVIDRLDLGSDDDDGNKA